MKPRLAFGPRGAVPEAEVRGRLARELGLVPASLALDHDPFGRPVLSCGGVALAFSLSRAGDHCVQALAREGRVGVDLVAEGALPASLADLLPEVERRVLAGLGPRADAALRQAWAAREALLKGLGVGLGWQGDLTLAWEGWWVPGTFAGRDLRADGWRLALDGRDEGQLALAWLQP